MDQNWEGRLLPWMSKSIEGKMNCFYCNKSDAQIEIEEYEYCYCDGTGDDPDMCGAPFCPYCGGKGYEKEEIE